MDKNMDMTVGNPTRHILLFAIPMLIGNLFQQVYNIADSMIVGRLLGADALHLRINGGIIWAAVRLGVPLSLQFSLIAISSMALQKVVNSFGAISLKITSIFYIFLEVIGRFTVPVLLTMYTPLGLWGIWWSVGIVWFLSGGTAYLRYLRYYRIAKKNCPDI